MALAANGGTEVSTDGDAFFVVFRWPADAVACAVQAQRALASEAWPPEAAIRVRMGIHTGAGELGGDNYAGIDVHLAARIAAAGHGGQVLLSEATGILVGRTLPADVAVRDLGTHRLKDFPQPMRLLQLAAAGLPDRFPPLMTVDAARTNIPPPVSALVGRSAELDAVLALLDRTRLVTLTGPGGTGKTRLATEAARAALTRFVDGVFLVNLDAIHDATLVATAVVQALGLREQDRTAEEALSRELAAKRMLLVLDNFEHVVPAAALVDRLLTAGPEVHFLITSRVPLQLYGEQEYELAPLGLPERGVTGTDDLSAYEAVALFVERARGVDPGFELTPENGPVVAEICRRLDGLPLAIELAAARMKLLTPSAVLERLSRRLDLLSNRSPHVPSRQRSMRAAIDWSWALLDDPERSLLARLAVFSGGWAMEAAEAVCADGLEIDVLDGLGALLDKSLVRRTDGADPRFGMLQTIQEFAGEQLAARSERPEIARRHAAHFRDLVEAAEAEFAGSDPAGAVQRLLPDLDNVRAALAWVIESEDFQTGARLASASWRFWQERGLLPEGRRWVERVLSLPGAGDPTPLRARLLTAAGGLAYWQGDHAARDFYEEALATYRLLNDPKGIADGLHNLAFTVLGSDRDAGIQLLQESLERFRELHDQRSVASAVGALSYAQLMAGRLEAARPGIEEALLLNEAHGVRGRANDNRFALGHVHRLAGDLPAAAEWYRAALTEVRAMGDASRTVMHLRAIAAFALAAGHYEEALRLAGAVERARAEQGGTIALPVPGAADTPEDVRRTRMLSDDEVAAALAAGRAMDLDAAADLALSVLAAAPSVEA